ncbi:MAG: ribosome biogenesis GTPase Der [Desulfobacterales bacterium C00003060]|nr:MAG: ribosome biogenesis GTPase Der [Desulfobacterales bacterium S3730MH5]OEU78452.1 MAG: ribosome biogenesis GTPase Der [Desulfobacterales bacterium C00003060]OEU81955.1 MAG: ribosome biogenesis GTPase Der [Desulfobacterales bacterium S5133MH4]
MKPVVAIVGRPNVGKSTLFNRITRSRKALVDNSPGVTRDRNYGDAQWDDVSFTLVDTGGFSDFESEGFGPLVKYQVMRAIEEADAIITLFDGREGVTPIDTDLVQRLRQCRKPVFYSVNKIHGPRHESFLSDFAVLGVDPLYPLSAEHGYGVHDILDALVAVLPRCTIDDASKRIKLAVIGRPNVGKSSLINRFLGDERLVVSEIPGTTRDAVDTICKVNNKEYVLIDTAGIRRRGRVRKKLEKFSIIKALRSLHRCDIALVMMDASEGVTEQDANIAGYAVERGRPCIILLNKWDLVEKDSKTAERYVNTVKDRLKFLAFAPVLTISALTGQRNIKIFDWVETVYEQYATRISTGRLNRIFETIVSKHQAPSYRGRRIKFYYAMQLSAAPPKFVCFVNYPEAIHFSYERYVINQLREATGMDRIPIRLVFRKRGKRS